jgi:hypothetical protein
METDAIVLSVAEGKASEFEEGFHRHELPIWQDFHKRGILMWASLQRMDISSRPTEGAVQYLIVAAFATDEGHHLHDSDPRFQEWNDRADAFQIATPMAFGGKTILKVGG